MKTKYLLAAYSVLALLLMSAQAKALPAFARANNLECAACHSAFPSLNSLGREFKTNGYRLTDASENTKTSDFTQELSKLPIAAAITSRPYTKDDPGNKEIRAIHELEIFVGGVFYKNLSGLAELEVEGEDGFGGATELTALNYDFNNAFHIQAAYAQTFFADPYDTLSGNRSLIAAPLNILNESFGGADNGGEGILRHPRQQVSVFGRVANNKLFYNLGIGGLTVDNIANQSTVGFGRLAYDITPSIMVGTFGVTGTCKTSTSSDFVEDCGKDANDVAATNDRDFSRYGFDAQADFGSLRLTAAYMTAKDDLVNSTESETNNDSYVQAVYFGRMGSKQIVPLLRYQTSESNDGQDETKRYVVGLSYYFQENFKASVEYGDDTSTPEGVDKVSNVTLQFQAAF